NAIEAESEARAKGTARGNPNSALNQVPLGRKTLPMLGQMAATQGNFSGIPIGRAGIGGLVGSEIRQATPEAMCPGENLAVQGASFSAAKANLHNLNKAKGMTSAQVSQLDKNSQMLLGLQDKIAETGVPILNQPVRSVLGRLG